MKAHGVAASATNCLQKVRRTLLVKLAIICFLLMALYGVAFKYIDMTITQKFQPLNMHGYDTEHGKVDGYRVLMTGESGKRVGLYKTFDVADSLTNRFNTGIVKNTQSPQNETQTDANVIPTDRSVPKAERLVRLPMADISQTGNKLTDTVNTTQAPQNDKQTDAISQVIPDRSVPKAERMVSMRMTDISQIANKLPGVLTNLQPLGPGIKESPEFPGMPDPCAGPKRMTGVEDILCMVRHTVCLFFGKCLDSRTSNEFVS
ncbi:hypothetical protein DPMN_030623 [Dreissena polymorpha]|uniref:Uncharacterized protein n=1 Tax=Dreissena polymorpha TaxID=45954 RepID=A0A9D4RGJ7_DREPO|nr:hypothetical protein DPMN_030623 [Dreissena polymorpha]